MIAGFDPGLSGGIAIIDEHTVHLLADMPTHKIGVAGKKAPRLELNLHGLCGILTGHSIEHCFIEKVSARPGQGVTSMFRFGYAAGAVYGAIATLGLPCSFVTPQAWQRYSSVGPAADEARQRAAQLYPQIASQLARRADANKADALLIARFGIDQLREPGAKMIQTAGPMRPAPPGPPGPRLAPPRFLPVPEDPEFTEPPPVAA